jgi:predicted porin
MKFLTQKWSKTTMKKTLIALAVAGVCTAPAAFAATANVDVYGKLRVSLDHVSADGMHSSWQLNDQTSRIGFKGTEDLGGGLKAIWQVESALGTAAGGGEFSNLGGTTLGSRDTFVGLAGDFGTVLAGKHDTPYKMAGSSDLFADTSADAENSSAIIGNDLDGNGLGGFDIRATNAIAYVSPAFSGLTLVGAVVPGEKTGTTQKAHNLADAYSLAGLYSNGPLSVNVAYEDHTANLVYDLTSVDAKESAWKVKVGYTIDAILLGATYEDQTGVDLNNGNGKMKSKNYLLSAAYGMGPITLAAQYGKRNVNGSAEANGKADLSRTTLGVVYSLSKRTSTYLAYDHDKYDHSAVAANNGKANIVTLGLNHEF